MKGDLTLCRRLKKGNKMQENEKIEQKNIFIALILSVLLVSTVNHFFGILPNSEGQKQEVSVLDKKDVKVLDKVKEATIPQKEKKGQDVLFENKVIKGSLNTKGAVFNQLDLKAYQQKVKKGSPAVRLLNKKSYFSTLGYVLDGKKVVSKDSVWSVEKGSLSASSPLVLSLTTKEGLVVKRVITLDDNYMFTISDVVQNTSLKNVEVQTVGQITRSNVQNLSRSPVHQGFIAVLDNALKEVKYPSVEEEKETYSSKDGWLGISDKYWLTAFIYNQGAFKTEFSYDKEQKAYDATFSSDSVVLQPDEIKTFKTHFFAGPKEIDLLTYYQKTFGVERFDLGIDFGWYYFITKPFLFTLEWIYRFVGNMGISILIFAFLIRLLMFPVASKSFESMAKMKKLQPKIKALQTRYKDDKMRLNQEMMLLYQKEKVNPASGCLPMLIQIPIFFSLYKVLSVSIQMRHAKFFGWIKDLSAPDMSSVFTFGGLVPWPVPAFLDIGVWPLLMGLTMLFQQKLNPSSPNKDQAAVLKWMPILFMFMFGRMASGLVIYWTWSNLLSILQQSYIMKKYGEK